MQKGQKLNKKFKDVFLDYPFPIGQLIVFTTANFPENVDEFLKQRMTAVKISANTFDERIDIARDLLSYEFEKYKIGSLRDKVSENLVKRMLTWEKGVRGLIDNAMKFSYKVYIDNKRGRLADDWENYKDWPITQRIELDSGSPERNRPACPVYTDLKAEHRSCCECFKPAEIADWVNNMGKDYPKI